MFAENVPAVLTTSVVERELQRAGVGLQDVTSTTLGFPDAGTGFANDVVDFGVLVEPYITLGEQRGVSQCWKPTSEMEPNFQIAVILYGPVFAEQRTYAARGFMVADLRALRDYQRAFFGDGQGRAELVETMGRVSGVSDRALLERLEPTWADPNGSVNVESLRDVQRWNVGRGEQNGEVDFRSRRGHELRGRRPRPYRPRPRSVSGASHARPRRLPVPTSPHGTRYPSPVPKSPHGTRYPWSEPVAHTRDG